MNNETLVKEALVSIVMPAYNCSDFIGTTIDSILNQTYKNFEIIIVDDCSTDDTPKIVLEYSQRDSRVKYHKLKENSGAAVARNTAVELANGKYMAFLDSDDVWFEDKLSKQIQFMKDNNYVFTCTGYTKIDDEGNYLNKTVKARKQSDYDDILKLNPGNSTVIYNVEAIGKVFIPNIRKRNDYVMWLQVIKKAKMLYGMQEALSSHRVREGSLSKDKTDLVGYHWTVYRDIEKLSLFKSVYLILFWIVIKVFKLR